MVTLREKSADDLADWFPAMFEQYYLDVLASGSTPEAARQNVNDNLARVAPEGVLLSTHHVFNALDAEEKVGVLWLAEPRVEGTSEWFVYDIEIEEAYRGRGYGRQTMQAAEAWVRDHGATRLALNVFGPNVVARGLYESLGYQVQAMAMFKELAG